MPMWWSQRRERSSTTWWWPRVGTWLRIDAGSSALCPSASWESECLCFLGAWFLQVPRMWLQCHAVHKGILTNRCYIRSAGFKRASIQSPQVLAKCLNCFNPFILFSVMSPPHSLLSRVIERAKLLPTHSYHRAYTHAPRLSLAKDL